MLLKDEIAETWEVKKVKIISVVEGFLRKVATGLEHFVEKIAL